MATRKLSPAALSFTSALTFSAPGESPFSPGDPRPFAGVAYSGGVIVDHGYWDKVIFDLSTTTAAQIIPILFAHDDTMPIGRGSLSIASDVSVSGFVYDDADGAKVLGKPGHPWEMSVYIKPKRIEELLAGASAVVNGQLFEGPGCIFRDNVIREVSFVSLGADPNTSAAVFAEGDTLDIEIVQIGAPLMTPEEIIAMQARVAELEAANEQFAAAAQTAAEEIARIARETRFAAVKTMFAAAGKDVDEASATPYLSMTQEQFSAVANDIATVRAALPKNLFSEQATGETAGLPATKSALMVDAERRAAKK